MWMTSKARLAVSAVVSGMLTAFPWLIAHTNYDWLGVPFFVPGFLGAAIVFNQGIHSDHPIVFMVLAEIINFALTWIVLIVLGKYLKNRIIKRRVSA